VRRRALAAVAAGAAALAAAPGAGGGPAAKIEIAFTRESYAPASVAALRLWTPAPAATLQVLHVGPEPGHTRRRDLVRGIAVGPPRRLGAQRVGSIVHIRIGDWASGLYVVRLTGGGRVAFAPFIVRPRRLGANRVLVVLPTYTWQAYNFRDDDGDGRGDTWYAQRGSPVRLHRPFTSRGVPPHFRHYDLPFLHWISRTGKPCDMIGDADLDRIGAGDALTRAYDLIVFEGHHEYVTSREFDAIERYRDDGGNLMFLSANNFFARVVRTGSTLRRIDEWRDLGRPEAALIGVQYRANDKLSKKAPWVVHTRAPWLLAGTRLRPGSPFGSGGIEIDARAASSPPGLQVLSRIPNLYGLGYTAQMTLYETAPGAKVFAAGAFELVESVIEPDAPLPDPEARRTRAQARRMLENLWRRLATP
jgi:hypothetical protein